MTSKWCKYIILKSVNFLLTYQKSNEWVFFLQKQQVRKYRTNQIEIFIILTFCLFKLFKFLSLYNFPLRVVNYTINDVIFQKLFKSKEKVENNAYVKFWRENK